MFNSLKQAINMKYEMILCLTLFTTATRADLVSDGNRKIYGKIIGMDENGVAIQVNGNGQAISFNWTTTLYVEFNDQLNAEQAAAANGRNPKLSTGSSPLTGPPRKGSPPLPPCNPMVMFQLDLKDQYATSGGTVAFATQMNIAGDEVFVVYASGRGIVRFNMAQFRQIVKSIRHSSVCAQLLVRDFPAPGAPKR
jgi:hypothetical protein